MVEELDGGGTALARYTQGLGIDEPLAMVRGGASYYYNADGLGSITSLTNSSGQIAATYTYDSFGKLTASTGPVTIPSAWSDCRSAKASVQVLMSMLKADRFGWRR